MAGSFYLRSLKPLDLTDMYMAFIDAFSDYPVAFKLTKEQFVRKFVEKLKIDFSLSIGAYDFDALVGFVFTSVGYYEGKKTAYNGGTGVRPAYRGNALISKIYEHLYPKFSEANIKQCVLEVLVTNQKALNAYERIGFQKSRYFKCFKLDRIKPEIRPLAITVDIFPAEKPNWLHYESFSTQLPSFLDSENMINANIANEDVLEAHYENRCIGYAIYQPSFGRISQLAVHPDFRQKGVGSHLIQYIYDRSHQKSLTVINISEEATETLAFFSQLGFENQLNQYEMILTL